MATNRARTARLVPIALLAAPLACIAVACDGGSPGAGRAMATEAGGQMKLPDGLVVAGEPSGTPVAECKAAAKQGETVTILGRIGGSRVPFTNDVATFTIVDPALKSCADGAEPDHCRYPWDYCCEDRAALKRSMATIELVNAAGEPLPFPVRGASGLVPLATVAVTGTVIDKNDAGVMVVRASRIVVK